MSRKVAIIARLSQTVELLGALADRFIFVGGSVTPLLVTDSGAQDARVTTDVDAVVEVLSRSQYNSVERELEASKFLLDPLEEVLCRYKYNGGELILDVMPTDENILTFGNQWYKLATEAPLSYELPTGRKINIINAPLFICTKFEAYKDRGKKDEKDLEDIVAVIDGRPGLLNEMRKASAEARIYIANQAKALLHSDFPERIDWFLPQETGSSQRESLVIERFTAMTKLETT